MQKLELHPYCILFPACTEEELQRLTEDIRQNGLLEPIVLLDGKILNGRNRYEACLHAGAEPPTVEFTGDDPLAFVLSKNLHRRHLSESQRAMIASEIANMPRGGNGSNQHETKPANLPVCENQSPQGFNQSRQVSQAEAAELLNVSERSVRTAAKIKKGASLEVIQQIKEGKKSLHAALSEQKPKPQHHPRRKTLAESQEPEEQGEFLKIPLPLDHMGLS